jgi:hypothetical protein
MPFLLPIRSKLANCKLSSRVKFLIRHLTILFCWQHFAFENIFLFAAPLFDFGSSPSPTPVGYIEVEE